LSIIAVAVGLMPMIAILSARPIARLLHRVLWPRPVEASQSRREPARGEPAAVAAPARVTRLEPGLSGARFDIACSRLSSHRVGKMAPVRAGERRRRGWSSGLGSVDHRGCCRSQSHSDFLVSERSGRFLRRKLWPRAQRGTSVVADRSGSTRKKEAIRPRN
jgi:hypothetical protein